MCLGTLGATLLKNMLDRISGKGIRTGDGVIQAGEETITTV